MANPYETDFAPTVSPNQGANPYDADFGGAPTAPGGVAQYLGKSFYAGGHALAGAGARLIEAFSPFTTAGAVASSEQFKNDPAALQDFLDNSPSMFLDRFARARAKSTQDIMAGAAAPTGTVSGGPVAALEYETTDPKKSAFLSPVKMLSDALVSLPSTLALMITARFGGRAAVTAGAEASTAALAAGATAEAAALAGKTAAIQAGAAAMSKTGAIGEGMVGYGQQFDQALEDAMKVPKATYEKSKDYQVLIADGYAPESARVALAYQVAAESSQAAGVADAIANAIGGHFLGKTIGEGGTLLRRTGKGVLNEAPVEFAQGALEQLGQNTTMKARLDPTQDLGQGVMEQALAGVAVGGLSGGATSAVFGGAHPSEKRAIAETKLAEATDIDQIAAAAVDLAGSVAEFQGAHDDFVAEIQQSARSVAETQQSVVSTPQAGMSAIDAVNQALRLRTERQIAYDTEFAQSQEAADLNATERINAPLVPRTGQAAEDTAVSRRLGAAALEAPFEEATQAPNLPANPVDAYISERARSTLARDVAFIKDVKAGNITREDIARTLPPAASKTFPGTSILKQSTKRGLAELGSSLESTLTEVAPEALPSARDVKPTEDGDLPLSREVHGALSAIAKTFGKRVVVFSSDTRVSDGTVLSSDPDTIYLNRDAQKPHMIVLGHEITHQMKADHPEAYAALEKVVQEQLGQTGLEKHKGDFDYGTGQLEEAAADLTGNRFQDPEFLQRVFEQVGKDLAPNKAQGVIARLANTISKIVSKVKATLLRQDSFAVDTMVADLDKVKAAVHTALVAYAKQRIKKGDDRTQIGSNRTQIGNTVDQVAHEAATSPQNALPEPTAAQKEAGNYRKGHLTVSGLDISIENPAGSTRKGVAANGKAWSSTLQHHYGYFKGTVGADGDHVDTFINPGTPENYSGPVFVVDQIHPETGRFDESKVMLGFDSEEAARLAYASNYDKGWKGLKKITRTSSTGLKSWLASGHTKRPFAFRTPEALARAPAGVDILSVSPGEQAREAIRSEYGRFTALQSRKRAESGKSVQADIGGKSAPTDIGRTPPALRVRPASSVAASAASAFAKSRTLSGVHQVAFSEVALQGEELLKSPPEQARIARLAESIQKTGSITPLTVGRHTDGSQYLMEGQHRARALQRLGYDSFPARIVEDQTPGGTPKILYSEKRAPGELPQVKPRFREALAAGAKGLTESEISKLREDTATKFVKLLETLPSSEEMAAVAWAGRAKRGWYKGTSEALVTVFGPDAPRFAALLASLSPQTSVEVNLQNALNVWKNWTAAGRPQAPREIRRIMGQSVQGHKGEKSVLNSWLNNGTSALTVEDPMDTQYSGPKVNSFFQNLVGNANEVTNDTWIANYAMIEQILFAGTKRLINGKVIGDKAWGYMAMSSRVRLAAQHLTELTGEEWTPAEVQETIWSWAKALYEAQKGGLTATDILYNEELTDELINATPDFRTLFQKDVYAKILEASGLGEDLAALRDERPGTAAVGRREGETAPFDSKTQSSFENAAARRLERLKSEGRPDRLKLSEKRQLVTGLKSAKVAALLLDSEAQSGPFDGGCLICAKAVIMAAQGGTLVRITSDANGGQTEHYAAQLRDGDILDASGVFSTSNAWIEGFKKREHTGNKNLAFAAGYDSASEIPDDPAYVKKVASALTARFSEKRQTDTPEFKKWFGESKVVDAKGAPLVVYHGTTYDITAFRSSRPSAVENDFGRGIYFTTNPQDASVNYAGEGLDLTGRIERLAEQIAANRDWEYNDPRATVLARKRLNGGSDNVLPVYMSLQNPVVLGGASPTYMREREASLFARAIGRALKQYTEATLGKGAQIYPGQRAKFYDLLDTAMDGAPAEDLIEKGRSAVEDLDDRRGNMVGSEVVRKALEHAGYDGIADHTVARKWGSERGPKTGMAGVDKDTTHYIAFKPTQIKSATGNQGTFDPKNPDIRKSEKRQPLTLEGVHYSQQPRAALTSNSAGTGYAGSERERGATKDRIYFYVDTGKGIKPEDGVGGYAHKATLTNIYDAGTDPDYLGQDAKGLNDFEKRVVDAGYDGYFVPDFNASQGAAVLLGERTVKVEKAGQGALPPSGAAVPSATREDAGFRATIAQLEKLKSLPGGALTPAKWGSTLKMVAPALHAEMANSGVFSSGTDPIYKNELVQRYKDVQQTVKASEKRQIETPEFRAWFGDSKVVDADGNPLRVYHGTNADVSEFDPARRPDRRSLVSKVHDMASAIGLVRARGRHNPNAFDSMIFGDRMAKAEALYGGGIPPLDALDMNVMFFTSSQPLANAYALTASAATGGAKVSEGAPNIIPVYLRAERLLTIDLTRRGTGTVVTLPDGSSHDIGRTSHIWDSVNRITFALAKKYNADGILAKGVFDTPLRRDPATSSADVYAVFQPAQIKSAIGNSGAFDPKNPDIRKSEKRTIVNIGLNVGEEVGAITPKEALAALKSEGVRVTAHEVRDSRTEPTLIATLDRPLTAEQAHQVSVALRQEAIAQRVGTEGELYGPSAKAWRPFNPDEFLEPEAKFSEKRAPFYSALARGIETLPTNSLSADGWASVIKSLVNKGAVKQVEVEAVGLPEFLKLQDGKITKAQVTEFLHVNGVHVTETSLGGGKGHTGDGDGDLHHEQEHWYTGDGDADLLVDRYGATEWAVYRTDDNDSELVGGPYGTENEAIEALNDMRLNSPGFTKFAKYQLPGGTNYREFALSLPSKEQPKQALTNWRATRFNEATGADYDGWNVLADMPDGRVFRSEIGAEDASTETEAIAGALRVAGAHAMTDQGGATNYKSPAGHGMGGAADVNRVVHFRVNDRTDADGKRVLFVEEIQSDWGQAGKKKGFIDSAFIGAQKEFDALYEERDRLADAAQKTGAWSEQAMARGMDIQRRFDALHKEFPGLSGGAVRTTPTGPFVTKTEAWVALALKRVIKLAVDEGYDKVAFINGEQSVARYDLSKQVSKVEYNPAAKALNAYDHGGDRVINKHGVEPSDLEGMIGKDAAAKLLETDLKPRAPGGDDKVHTLSGADLKVGGEGMKAFYDKIVPSVAKDVLRKVGGNELRQVRIKDGIEQVTGNDPTWHPDGAAQTGFDITPAMRDKAAGGLPLFSPKRNIYNKIVAPTWAMPQASRLDDVLYRLQDKHIDLKRVTQAIGAIADKFDPYLGETLYHGRSAKATQDFANNELKPLLVEMKARGVDVKDFEEYLHNRHAEERNVQIAKVNPAMPDGGSGLKTADARKYLAALTPVQQRSYAVLAARVDRINAGTRALLVSSGLETQKTVDAWEKTYSRYVPLQRADMDLGQHGSGTGAGFSTKGSASKRAMGSEREVVDILANLARQREITITRAEKNRVSQALYGLAVQRPNPDFWLPVNPDAKPANPAAHHILMSELIHLGMSPMDADGLIKEPVQRFIDPSTGLVTERINPALRNRENVISMRVDGKDRFVFMNQQDARAERLAEAFKNLDAQPLGEIMSVFGVTSRWVASVNTQYNPIFGAVNLTRDLQGATLNLSTTPIAGKQTEVLSHVLPALRGIYIDVRHTRAGTPSTSAWSQLWEEFQREGGQTGYKSVYAGSEERAKAIASELRQLSEGKLKQGGRAILDWLSDYNESVENSVRLAAYKVAKDSGMTAARAAELAKDVTVNFNRKGEIATQAGALYAFFNAAVQGTERTVRVLRGPAGRKILYGGLLLGVLQALAIAAAGFDDGEPPDQVKDRSFVFPLGGGKYITIPMPLGFNVIPGVSRQFTEFALRGFREPTKLLGGLGALATSLNPIGSSSTLSQTLAPTALDPIVALGQNKDNFGRPIAKEDHSGLKPTPGFTRKKDTSTFVADVLAEAVNWATGGTKYTPGMVSPTPDQIDFLAGQVGGGVAREAGKIAQAVSSQFTGETLPPYKIPVLGRFYGDTNTPSAQAAEFYRNAARLGEHELELAGRRKDHAGGVAEYIAAHPEAVLVPMAKEVERKVSELRAKKSAALEKGDANRVKMLEELISMRMKILNDRVKELAPK